MRLSGKIAVVTGAASGIGLAVTERFLAEGAHVVAGDINAERLDALASSAKPQGSHIVGLKGNIAERGAAEALVDKAIESFGRLDILCNVAGIMDQIHGVGDLTDETWRRVLGVNLDGPMYTMRRAVTHMMSRGGGGAIVNVASLAGISGSLAGAAYTASKHGLVGLTRQTAHRYSRDGIRCNAICPGTVITNITESMGQSPDPAGLAQVFALASLAPSALEPGDIASLVLFLASDESVKINGAIIPADAGWLA